MNPTEKEVAIRGPMASPSVSIDWEVYQKIMYWVRKAPGEISGLGKVICQDNGVFRIVSAVLVKQENGASSTDMDAAAVSKAMFELKDEPGHLNFWWHSHVNMDVFWSGTDIDTIREIGEQGFVVATVFNKQNKMKSAYYVKATNILPETFFDDIPTKPVYPIKKDQVTAWDAEYDAKTTVKTWRSWNNYGDGFDDYESQWQYDPTSGRYIDKGKKSLTKAEKRAQKKLSRANSTKSSDVINELPNDEAKRQALMYQCDAMSAEWYNKGVTYGSSRKILNQIVGLITITKFVNDDISEELKNEWIAEFNALWKETPTLQTDAQELAN